MSEPVVRRLGPTLVFDWEAEGIAAAVRSIREGRDHVRAEVTWTTTTDPSGTHLHISVLSLTSASAKRSVARALEECLPDVDWLAKVEVLAAYTLREFRTGRPPVAIRTGPGASVETPKLIEPFFFEGLPTIVFGPPDSCKSFVVLIAAALGATGHVLAGVPLKTTRALRPMYLDWEAAEHDMISRAARLERGLGIDLDGAIQYRRCDRPLAAEADELHEYIADLGIDLLIIDSLGPACGGDLTGAEPAMMLFSALRGLGTTSAVVAHVAKGAEMSKRTIYGTVFFEALARSTVEVRRHRSASPFEARIELVHRKSNVSAKAPPFGLKLSFVDDGLAVRHLDLEEVREERDNTSGQRVKAAIAGIGAGAPKDLAKAAGIPSNTVRSTLKRLVERGEIVKLGDGTYTLPESVNDVTPF